ncbi:EF-hand domain-containing protein [Chitinivorax sp. B]|uniref:EF-hand domain-containing protein n=1 Tax=Chitinivorax sp. B TaxID=2502235 RepID=UPI0010F5BE14|nr:EF-hand domain-containing protein [Chitinivorax sp. B]
MSTTTTLDSLVLPCNQASSDKQVQAVNLSPFQVEKFTALFNFYDQNHDGFLALEEFVEHARRVAKAFGWDENDPRTHYLVDIRTALFWRLGAATEHNGDLVVSLSDYLCYFERQVYACESANGPSPSLKQACRAIMDLIDHDGSDCITYEEYRNLLVAIGSRASAWDAFCTMDADKDGRLTLHDVEQLAYQFIVSSDPQSPGNLLYYGRL